MRSGHGEWLPMLREVGINAREAQRYMEVAANLKCAKFALRLRAYVDRTLPDQQPRP